MGTPAEFHFQIPFATLWKAEDGAMRFLGVASSTRLDKQRERMTLDALDMLATARNIPLLNWPAGSHAGDPSLAVGKAERFWREGEKLYVEGVLYDWVPEAHTIYDQALSKGGPVEYGLSVGGTVDRTYSNGETVLPRAAMSNLVIAPIDRVQNPDCAFMALAKAIDCSDDPHKETTMPDTLEKASTDLTETLAEERGEYLAEEAAWATSDMLDALNATLGQIMAQEIAESEKRTLVEQAMADFGAKLCEKLWIDQQPMMELAKAENEQEVGDMPDPIEETPAEPEAEVVETPAATPEVTEEEAPVDPEADDETPAEAEPESAPEETEQPEDEPEGETEDKTPAEEVPLAKAEASPEFAEALEKATAPLQEELAKAQARIAELEGQPTAGGPASTAERETEDRTADLEPLAKADPVRAARDAGDMDQARRINAARAMGARV